MQKINQFYNVSFLYKDIDLEINNFIEIAKNSKIAKISKIAKFQENKEKIIKQEKKQKPEQQKVTIFPGKNLSVEVLINNLKVAKISLKENIFGWGLHNYKHAHKFYIEKVNTSNVKGSTWLNYTDGSNNFNKGLVEFGIIFFIPLILLFILLIDKKIDPEIKLLIFPILFSQTFIRGSGFFNGGFILFLIILLSLYFNKKQIIKPNK